LTLQGKNNITSLLKDLFLKVAMAYFFITLLIFASMEVVSKPLMGVIDPFVLTFWRFLFGFLFFLFYPGLKKRFAEIARFGKNEWLSVVLLGILNSFLAMCFLQVAVKMSSAATSATVFCSNPVFVLIFASIAGMEKFSIKKMVGLMGGFAAVAVIMSEKGFVFKEGMLFALLAAVIFAFYTVLSKKIVSNITPFTVNLTSFFFGLLANFVFIFFYELPFLPTGSFFSDIEKISAFIYLALVVTGIGYVTFFETIKRFTALGASLIFLLKPAVAVVFAYLFLEENLSMNFFAGLLLLGSATLIILSDKIKDLINSKLYVKP